MSAGQRPHRWQTAAITLGRQSPFAPDGGPGADPGKEQRNSALEGSLITADAIQCQQESSRFVTQELGADYIWGLKGNQSGILERAQIRLPQRFFSP